MLCASVRGTPGCVRNGTTWPILGDCRRIQWAWLLLCTLASACIHAPPKAAPRAAPSAGSDATSCDGSRDAACSPAADGGKPAAACPSDGATGITLGSLLGELTDLDHLTRLPQPAYQSLLASSFDRASSGASPDSAAWFANRDWATIEPGTPLVLLDARGPGVITHLWSANPSGTLRVYIDGAATPVLEAPMQALLGGEVEPFTHPYGFVAGSGRNLYFPMPFGKRCLITVTSDQKRLYYQIDYRVYARGVQLQSLSTEALAAASCERERAAARLADAFAEPGSGSTQRFSVSLEPGARWSQPLAAAPGGSVLRELQLVVDPLQPGTLRATMLSIEMDGEETVRVPLGDFFGTGPEIAELQSLATRVQAQAQTLTARWPMPFAREARITLQASDHAALAAQLSVSIAPRTWDDRSLHFYAHWHPPAWSKSEPPHDLQVMALQGTGLYVGNVLNLINTDAAWWGEGDSKLYVDGEAFPSHFGTGTEDDYGYAWCSNALFSTPFVGQTRAGQHKNFGAISLYRLRTLDAVPFNSSLRFDLEVNHWGDTARDMEHDALVYFYARPGARATPTAADPKLYRVPQNPAALPADVAAGPYTCGGP